jgi:hypothetical protein
VVLGIRWVMKNGKVGVKAIEGIKQVPDFLDQLDKWLEDTGYSTYNEEAEEAEKNHRIRTRGKRTRENQR